MSTSSIDPVKLGNAAAIARRLLEGKEINEANVLGVLSDPVAVEEIKRTGLVDSDVEALRNGSLAGLVAATVKKPTPPVTPSNDSSGARPEVIPHSLKLTKDKEVEVSFPDEVSVDVNELNRVFSSEVVFTSKDGKVYAKLIKDLEGKELEKSVVAAKGENEIELKLKIGEDKGFDWAFWGKYGGAVVLALGGLIGLFKSEEAGGKGISALAIIGGAALAFGKSVYNYFSSGDKNPAPVTPENGSK